MILVAGFSLGMAHNWVGLASRPPRGIPWKASSASLPQLESEAPPDRVPRAPQPQPVAADPVSPPPKPTPERSPTPHATATPASPATKSPQATPTKPVTEPATPPSQATEPASTPAAPPVAGSAARLPYVPDMDRPLETKIATVKRFFDAGGALFLDARDASEYEAGHIPGALRLTQSDALSEPEKLKTLPVAGRPIIAYCEGGECEASRELAQALLDSGFRKVLVYTGGFPEWAAAGYPVERGHGGK